MAYIIMFLTSVMFGLIARELYINNGKKYAINYFFILSVIPIFILYAFRGNVGTDHNQYVRILEQISHYNDVSLNTFGEIYSKVGVEFFFAIICLISNHLRLGITGVYVFSALICIYYYIKALKFYDTKRRYIFFINLIFISQLFFRGMDAVRQIIAIMIFLYASRFIVESNIKKYLMYIFLASGFHLSVIFMIPVYWINKIRLNTKVFIGLVGLTLIFSDFLKFDNIILIISKILPNIPYTRYIGRDVVYGGTIGVIYILYFFLAVYMCTKVNQIKSEKDLITIKTFIIYVLFFPYFSASLSLGRILLYFNIFIILAIPLFGKYVDRKYKILYNSFFIILFIVLFMASLKGAYSNPERNLIPYEFFI